MTLTHFYLPKWQKVVRIYFSCRVVSKEDGKSVKRKKIVFEINSVPFIANYCKKFIGLFHFTSLNNHFFPYWEEPIAQDLSSLLNLEVVSEYLESSLVFNVQPSFYALKKIYWLENLWEHKLFTSVPVPKFTIFWIPVSSIPIQSWNQQYRKYYFGKEKEIKSWKLEFITVRKLEQKTLGYVNRYSIY